MKGTLKICLGIAFSLFLTSCDYLMITTPFSISKRTAKNLITESLMEEDDVEHYLTIDTGCYEENSSDARFLLRRLAAAGVITYKAEKISYKEKYVRNWYYKGGERVYEYGERQKYAHFVTIGHTEAGKACVPEEVFSYTPPADKYAPAFDKRQYPEDTVSVFEYFPGDEKPVAYEAESKTSSTAQDFQGPEIETTVYDLMKSREERKNHVVRAYSVKVADVRNIRVKDGLATCEYITEIYNTTPFGRVMLNVRNGYNHAEDHEFVRFQDKGWQNY